MEKFNKAENLGQENLQPSANVVEKVGCAAVNAVLHPIDTADIVLTTVLRKTVLKNFGKNISIVG